MKQILIISFLFAFGMNAVESNVTRSSAPSKEDSEIITPVGQTAEKTVYLRYSEGELTGFDPVYPDYVSGPFRPSITGEKILIKNRSECSLSNNVMYLRLTPSIPNGDWLRGRITLTIDGLQNLGTIDTWEGNSPLNVDIKQSTMNDLIITYYGNADLFGTTRYWWIPCSRDSQQGFILSVF